MSESFDDLQQLAGEYVLGTLDRDTRRQVAQRMLGEPVLRVAIEEWERRLLPLAALAAPEQPSSQLWPRIVKGLVPHVAAATGSTDRRFNWWQRLNNNLSLWRTLSAGGFAAACVFGALLVNQPETGAPAFMAVLVAPQDQAPGWIVQTSLDRKVVLTPLRPVAVPANKALQFWTKGNNWTGPVSLGLVQPGQSLRVALDKLPLTMANQLFEITLEPERGSPTGKPSGPVLFIGRTVKVM
ncbi:MAG: anti-sigma-K factor RskA [Janthinobacterium sp.]|jgi:anti-sigma-K factor RskA